MPLFQGTQQQYYDNSQTLVSTGAAALPALTFDPLPAAEIEFDLFVGGNEIAGNLYTYNASNGVITMDTALASGTQAVVRQIAQNEQLGNYQYIGIDDLIANFQVNYVGEDKIIRKVKIPEISFHVQRAVAELSYDTLRSEKTQEIEIPPSLNMRLPHDYVNYVKLSWKDDAGIERVLYPARKTSNPTAVAQAGDFSYTFDNDGNLLTASDSDAWARYQAANQADNSDSNDNYKKTEEDFDVLQGRRYGIEPENAQFNGIFYIDENKGYIHFSSTMNGKTVSLKYISDGLATDGDMVVHKFAEEAVYKYIAYAIASTHTSVNPSFIPMLKKERFAAIRKAKLRLSNIKIEEITQVMRGKSKQIKH